MGQWLVAAYKPRLLQRAPGKIVSPKPSTIKGIESFRFYAFAPPGLPLDQYAAYLYCGIRVHRPFCSKGVA